MSTKITKENVEVPPYIVNRFKIVPKAMDDKTITFDYLEEIDDSDIHDVSFLLNKEIVLDKQIKERTFKSRVKALYPEVATEPEKESPVPKKAITDPSELVQPEYLEDQPDKGTKSDEDDASEDAQGQPITYGYDDDPNPEVMDMDQFIKEISTEVLEKELRGRYLSREMVGTIISSKDGLQFSLDEMKWPEGAFRVKINFIEEVTAQLAEAQRKAQEQNNKTGE